MSTGTDTTLSVAVGGMTCGACAARVEKRLNSLDGVEAVVNYASERARVRARPGIPVDDILEAVRATGYTAEALDEHRPAAREDDQAERQVVSLRRRLLVAFLLFMPVGELSLLFSLFPEYRFPFWQALLLLLAAPVITWCAWPFYRAAWRAARHRTSTMDTLVSLGILAATAWSLVAMFVIPPSDASGTLLERLTTLSSALYFEVAAGVTTFLLMGRYFEATWRRRTGHVLRSLAEVGAADAAVLDAKGIERRMPTAMLAVDDLIVVRPGETIATDGIVHAGQSAVDRSSMTGESVPVDVGEGDEVLGGTICLQGRIVVRATRVGQDTQLATMLEMVEDAQNQKAAAQRLADRIAEIFVPAIIAISLATLAGWLLAGAAPEKAFSAAIAVLIIACPCALGLATPAALLVATGRGARLGVFFKSYEGLEASRRVDTVVFDKTGTITSGSMAVTDVAAANGHTKAEVLRWAAAVEQASEHPLARAIVAEAQPSGALPPVTEFEALPGMGARGRVSGRLVEIGRRLLVDPAVVSTPLGLRTRWNEWQQTPATAVLVSLDGEIVGGIAASDSVRPTAAAAVARLRALGMRVLLLTGDNPAAAAAVAAEAGIDEVISEAMPQDKAAIVERLRGEGRVVAVVGDGINDAAALALADLGLAVGTGTHVAQAAADLIIMRDDLRAVPTAIGLARATIRTIRGNLVWAFCYNVAAIPLAALGYLNPLIAGAAMAMSSALVVWNSSRLDRFRPDEADADASTLPRPRQPEAAW